MKEFLLALLQAVIIAATPVLTAYACKLINKAAGWFSAKTNSRVVEKYSYEIADIISTSVTYAPQQCGWKTFSSGTLCMATGMRSIEASVMRSAPM